MAQRFYTLIQMGTKRNSNTELLRILAMFMILLIHANYKTFGAPSGISLSTFLRSSLESFTLSAIPLFVLISGYWGITLKIEKIGALVFQTLFALIPSLLLYIAAYHPHSLVPRDFRFWFIQSYLGLLVLAPVLNAFANRITKPLVKYIFIISLLFSFGDLVCPTLGIKHGYSTLWFCLLYLMGRCLRFKRLSITTSTSVLVILASTLVSGAICMFVPVLNTYTNPFIVLIAIMFITMAMGREQFHSRWINSISQSVTMVYLTNDSRVGSIFYKDFLQNTYANNSIMIFLLISILFMVVWFVLSIIYDRLRIVIWKGVYRLFSSKLEKYDKRLIEYQTKL